MAKEYGDGEGDRYVEPDKIRKSPEELAERALDLIDNTAKAIEYAHHSQVTQRWQLPDGPRLGNGHSASVSRSLRRLEERGLVERKTLSTRRTGAGREWVETLGDETRTTHIQLTDAGEQAAAEVQRRVDDGRRNLSFETAPWA